jgi:hypothetical protein
MKRKLLLISLAVVMALAFLMPTTALAAPPKFSASGTLTWISTGTVWPVIPGNTGFGWYNVKDRVVSGTLSGDIQGDFTLTYDGLFFVPTQDGTLSGILSTAEGYQFNVAGGTKFLGFDATTGAPELEINGTWNGDKVGNRNVNKQYKNYSGTFDGWVIFVPTPDYHVKYIIASSFTMTGNK